MPQDEAAAPYLRRIAEVYPQIQARSASTVHDHGQNNAVVVVNDDLVFRFPRNLNGVGRLAAEAELLTRLQGRLPLPLPDPRFSSFAPMAIGAVFMGYRRIPGEPLTLDALRAYGVRTVVDLRRGYELAAAAHPFAGGADPAYVNVNLDEAVPGLVGLASAEYYRRVLDVRGPSFAAAVAAFANAPPGGVLFHCHSGKDRTGIVVALLLALAGVPRETIVADYVLTDECLAGYRDEFLRTASGDPATVAADLEGWRARPEKIEGMLDRLEALGGAAAYLRTAGLSPDNVERARARLR